MDGDGSTPEMICSDLSESWGRSQTDWARTIRTNAEHCVHRSLALPDTRTTISKISNAMSSALLSAAKTTRPTSSATGRVIKGAVNLIGVANNDTPAVIPNQMKQT